MKLYQFIQREFLYIKKHSAVFAILLIAPLAYAAFYGSVYFHKAEENVPIIIVDSDQSSMSRTIIQQINTHPMVNVLETMTDIEQAKDRFKDFDAYGVLYIPSNFQASIKSGSQANLALYLNAGRFLISNDLNRAINEVVGTMSAAIRLKSFQAQGMSYEQAMAQAMPIRADIRPMFNLTDNYGNFFLPGLLMMVLQQTLLIGITVSVAHERESNSLTELYNMAGKRIPAMLWGKSAGYLLLFAFYAVFYFVIYFRFYNVPFGGNMLLLALLMTVYLPALVCFGLFLGTFFRYKAVALQIFVISTYPIFFLSGFAWPDFAMPAALRVLAQFIPTTPMMGALVRITQMNADFGHVWPEIVHLAGLTFFFAALAVYRMKTLLTPETNGLTVSPLHQGALENN